MAKETQHRKGPHRMATAYKPETQQDDRDVDATIKAFAEKANRVVQNARAKMNPEERERADRNANSILGDASAAAKEAQRRA
jgi:hypothetical protein